MKLQAPAAEGRIQPALPAEAPVTADNRALELRVYLGEALLDVRHFSGGAPVTIGESRRADLFLSSEWLPLDQFPLVRTLGAGAVLTFARRMEGELETDGRLWSLESLVTSGRARPDPELAHCFRVRLPTGARALVHWGGLTIAMRYVAPPQVVAAAASRSFDLQFINTVMVSVCLHAALVVTLLLYPYDVQALQRQTFADVFVELSPRISATPPPPTPPKPPGAQPRREEPRRRAAPDESVRPTSRLGLSSSRADNAALRARLMRELLSSSEGGLLGGGMTGALEGLARNIIVSSGTQGISALDIRGPSPAGGGGPGGNFGNLREGGDIRMLGAGRPPGPVSLGTRRPRPAMVELQPGQPQDPVTRQEIEKVVQQNRNQIRFCYEQELHRDSTLRGRVYVHWVIGATGEVVSVSVLESSLGSAAVERCIVEHIRKWVFLPPRGGGTVDVRYPFVLQSF